MLKGGVKSRDSGFEIRDESGAPPVLIPKPQDRKPKTESYESRSQIQSRIPNPGFPMPDIVLKATNVAKT